MTQPTLVSLHSNEYNHGLRYYPFTVNLDRCVGSCNTLNDLPYKICVEYIFKIVLHSYEEKCKYGGRNGNSKQKWNKGKYRYECKNPRKLHLCEKILYLKSCYLSL